MKRLILIVIALICQCCLASSEDNRSDPVAIALGLLEKGKYENAITVLTPVAESASADNPTRGRAWTVMGFAYMESGQFQQARHCYEQALGLFGPSAEFDADRAAALDYFGNLETDLGDQPGAQRLLKQSLQIEQRLGDHARLSSVFTHLAGVAIVQKHYKDAKKYLESAAKEGGLVTIEKPQFVADLYATRGWLASVTGQTGEAVEYYRRSLAACNEEFGNQHPVTGWSYLLLGKAIAADGHVEEGLKSVRQGLAILEATAGAGNLRYLTGEIVYSQLLDRSGAHAESARLASAARQEIDKKLKNQCVDCTVSVRSLDRK